MNKKNVFIAGSLLALSLLFSFPALADNGSGGGGFFSRLFAGIENFFHFHKKDEGKSLAMLSGRSLFGTATAVNGNIITIKGKDSTTYTVDATHATITKSGVAIQLADIAVGDMILARGTLTDTHLVATNIVDGLPSSGDNRSGTIGSISSISGSIVTILGKDGVTYTVDVSASKLIKHGAIITLTDLKVGDTVLVHGAISGTSIIADTVMDGLPMQAGTRGSENAQGLINNGNFTVGTVVSVSGPVLTVTVKNIPSPQAGGTSSSVTYTVTTTSTTIFKKDGAPASLADVIAGRLVVISGVKDSVAKTITATTVNIATHTPLTGKMINNGVHSSASPKKQ